MSMTMMVIVWIIGGSWTWMCVKAAGEVSRSWPRKNGRGHRLGRWLAYHKAII